MIHIQYVSVYIKTHYDFSFSAHNVGIKKGNNPFEEQLIQGFYFSFFLSVNCIMLAIYLDAINFLIVLLGSTQPR